MTAIIYSLYTLQVATQLTQTALETQLESSVDTGVFTAMLQSNAAADGATGLETASSAAIVVTDSDSGGSDNDLSDGALAGIIIGCVAGVVLIAGAVYFFCSGKKNLLNSPNVEL